MIPCYSIDCERGCPLSEKVDDVSDLRDVFLYCRDFSHAWFVEHQSRIRSNGVATRVLECRRCKTLRTDEVIARTGELFYRRYTYPDGYCLKAGAERVTKQQVRVLAIKAMTRMRRAS